MWWHCQQQLLQYTHTQTDRHRHDCAVSASRWMISIERQRKVAASMLTQPHYYCHWCSITSLLGGTAKHCLFVAGYCSFSKAQSWKKISSVIPLSLSLTHCPAQIVACSFLSLNCAELCSSGRQVGIVLVQARITVKMKLKSGEREKEVSFSLCRLFTCQSLPPPLLLLLSIIVI